MLQWILLDLFLFLLPNSPFVYFGGIARSCVSNTDLDTPCSLSIYSFACPLSLNSCWKIHEEISIIMPRVAWKAVDVAWNDYLANGVAFGASVVTVHKRVDDETNMLKPSKSLRTSASTEKWLGICGRPPTYRRRFCSDRPFQCSAASVLTHLSNVGRGYGGGLWVDRSLRAAAGFPREGSTPGPIFKGRPRKSLPFKTRIARSACSFSVSSTKQYDGLRPENGSIDILICSLCDAV